MANITYLDKNKNIKDGVRDQWRDSDANEVKTAVNSKVDKVDGKGLSTNDYTDNDQTKVNAVPDNITAQLAGKQPLHANLTEWSTIDLSTDDGMVVVENEGLVNKSINEVKEFLVLDEVDNTSDLNKPVSTAQQTAIDTAFAGVASRIAPPVADLAGLKAIDTTNATIWPDKIIILAETIGQYRLDRDSSATGDDDGVVQPTTGVGRWIKMNVSNTASFSTLTGNATDNASLAAALGAKANKAGDSFTGAINEAQGANIASATTTDIGAATGNSVTVTGTTTITNLGTVQAGTRRIVTFSGILILTHNATSLILPTAANITTQAGDVVAFISLGSGNWRCSSYTRANGTPLAGGGGGSVTSVGLSMPPNFTVTNSPVTSSGTLTVANNGGSAYNMLGVINTASFANLSEFTQSASVFSVASNILSFTGASNSLSTLANILRLTASNNLEKWRQQIRIVTGAQSGTSYAPCLGTYSPATYGYSWQFELTLDTAAGVGVIKSYYNQSLTAYRTSSGAALTVSSGNTIDLIVEYIINRFVITATNITTGESITDSFLVPVYYPQLTQINPNRGNFSIFARSSSHTVTQYNISSKETYSDIFFIGDSILKGYNCDSIENRAVNLLQQNSSYRISYIGGAGNNIADHVATVAQTQTLVANKTVFILLGTNDLSQGRSAAQVDTDLASYVASLTSVGATVYVCALLPRGSVNVTATNALLKTRYGANYIDTNPPLRANVGTSGILSYFDTGVSGTLLHPINPGHQILADTLSNYFPNLFNNQIKTFYPPIDGRIIGDGRGNFSNSMNFTGVMSFALTNSNSGNTSLAAYTLTNDSGIVGGLYHYSSTYTSFPSYTALANNGGGFIVSAFGASGQVRFYTGAGVTLRYTIDSSGNHTIAGGTYGLTISGNLTISCSTGVGSFNSGSTATQGTFTVFSGTTDANVVAYRAADSNFPKYAALGNGATGAGGVALVAYGDSNSRIKMVVGGATTSSVEAVFSPTGLFVGGNTDPSDVLHIVSGGAIRLGNAATTGLVAGELAALTNATITLKDSTGQVYRIPCII